MLVQYIPRALVKDKGILLSSYELCFTFMVLVDIHQHEGEHVPVAADVVGEHHDTPYESSRLDKVNAVNLLSDVNAIVINLIPFIFI